MLADLGKASLETREPVPEPILVDQLDEVGIYS